MGGGLGIGSILSLVGTFASMMMSPSAPSAPAPAAPPPPPAPAPLPPPVEAPAIENNIGGEDQVNVESAKLQAAQRRRSEQQKQLTVLNSTSSGNSNGKSLLGE